jgi:hypothetical protein
MSKGAKVEVSVRKSLSAGVSKIPLASAGDSAEPSTISRPLGLILSSDGFSETRSMILAAARMFSSPFPAVIELTEANPNCEPYI